MIKGENIELVYEDGTIGLTDIDIEIGKGELVYLIGPSGSGKTSLLKLFLGENRPSSGSLEVFGYKVSKENTSGIRAMRREIGPVFQDFRLISGRTVLDNVMQGIRFLDIPSKELQSRASLALEKVGLSHKTLAQAEHLSWGERQRVSIARAIARKPKLILADEPTGNLDKENALKILSLLTDLRNEDIAVVITTHATHLINEADEAKVIYVNQGRISTERLGWAK